MMLGMVSTYGTAQCPSPQVSRSPVGTGSPFAKAGLAIALVSFSITLLMIISLSFLNAPEGIGTLASCTIFGGLFLNVYILAPLTLLVILIGIVHKLIVGKERPAWGRLGIAFLITCVSVAGSMWAWIILFRDLH